MLGSNHALCRLCVRVNNAPQRKLSLKAFSLQNEVPSEENSRQTYETEDRRSKASVGLSSISTILRGIKPASQNYIASSESSTSFDYFVVVDFEATCDSTMFFPQEIIEFPSVLVEAKSLSVVEESFQTYVKPIYHPKLTEFCRKLTGIQQTQVDNGMFLSEALLKHDKWLDDKGVKGSKFGVVTWTDWDCKVMLESECKMKNLKKPAYFEKWINLKSLFQTHYNEKYNLKRAVMRAGLEWQGREHCGLDDAKNTASLAVEMIRKGVQMSFTDSSSPVSGFDDFLPRMKRALSYCSSTPSLLSKPNPGLCFCGVQCRMSSVPSQGKNFLQCGNWTVTQGGKCTYFEWVLTPPTL